MAAGVVSRTAQHSPPPACPVWCRLQQQAQDQVRSRLVGCCAAHPAVYMYPINLSLFICCIPHAGFEVTSLIELPPPGGIIALWAVVLPTLYLLSTSITNLVLRDHTILKGPCPNCGTDNFTYFGDIFTGEWSPTLWDVVSLWCVQQQSSACTGHLTMSCCVPCHVAPSIVCINTACWCCAKESAPVCCVALCGQQLRVFVSARSTFLDSHFAYNQSVQPYVLMCCCCCFCLLQCLATRA